MQAALGKGLGLRNNAVNAEICTSPGASTARPFVAGLHRELHGNDPPEVSSVGHVCTVHHAFIEPHILTG